MLDVPDVALAEDAEREPDAHRGEGEPADAARQECEEAAERAVDADRGTRIRFGRPGVREADAACIERPDDAERDERRADDVRQPEARQCPPRPGDPAE